MRLMLAIAACMSVGLTSGQPDDADRREMLESRRELLAERIAQIDAELRGEAPAGSVRIFGQPDEGRFDRPPPDEDGGRGRRERRGGDFDPESRERVLRALAEKHPELADRVRRSVEHGSGRSGPVFGRLQEMIELRDADPEAFEARRGEIEAGLDVLRLAGELKSAIRDGTDEQQIAAVSANLREAVERGFDAKGAVLRLEIERQQSRLDEMQQRLAHAETNRSEIIAAHFDRLLKRVRAAAEREAKSGE